MQTTSKRVAERKVAKFEKNITRRGLAGVTSTKNKFTLDNIVIAFCIFVIVGSYNQASYTGGITSISKMHGRRDRGFNSGDWLSSLTNNEILLCYRGAS
ncbi:hypothetical protein LguiB_034265 [Lonicera macranthoides]